MHDMIYFSLNGKSRMLGDFRIFSCQIGLELSLCISRGVVSPAVYLASLMVVLICFLVYHTEFEHEVSIWQVRV